MAGWNKTTFQVYKLSRILKGSRHRFDQEITKLKSSNQQPASSIPKGSRHRIKQELTRLISSNQHPATRSGSIPRINQ